MFQSTRPGRGATCNDDVVLSKVPVSIHAPRTGRDASSGPPAVCRPPVSIHAPRTGRDVVAWANTYRYVFCFNPRAPDGARHTRPTWRAHRTKFQSTRPGRGATFRLCECLPACFRFNPRAPDGARPASMPMYIIPYLFQSTRPECFPI